MYKTTANPRRVLIWQHEETTPELEEIAQDGKLDELPPVPVFELPAQYSHLGDYVLHDGHKRREAARRTNSNLQLLVLECAKDFSFVKEYNAPAWYNKSPEEFEWWVDLQIKSALRYMDIDLQTLCKK